MAARVLKLHDMWVPLPGNLSFLEFRLVKSRQVLGYLKYPENLSLETGQPDSLCTTVPVSAAFMGLD
ncbi:hypothetical protein MGG_17943 [Pyricularia oryzae 70-15]|uniref:Uncharacterized protein n=3 Tax=Pyricularia oryzae TaxID=318829 RepID=G5EI33_PYRO7|nr:uncharacterized protein MGG_17943 [Pyricularia oryzae 70-15]EAQ71226.1 hypothetical protein MGCH7_ch7g633 [Pyricularia oryzae 70-15]EHA46114.1 hypothetical protein MGG_17943 [Pyricularia oryzae 70-15]ELQ43468.1 hypothetical protein OOU_Y34scaffold00150g15 [Pyricularia oryzae Y34]